MWKLFSENGFQISPSKGVTADEQLNKLHMRPKENSRWGEVAYPVEHELGIISTKGYSPYFLIVRDLAKYSRDNGIVQNTRGSAAGSLVSYVLGITTVDPLKYYLPFERFLNPFRPSPPDIDFDVADDKRDLIIGYITKHTDGKMLPRSVLSEEC
jgi:DNA polymerase-3 subunit alpha